VRSGGQGTCLLSPSAWVFEASAARTASSGAPGGGLTTMRLPASRAVLGACHFRCLIGLIGQLQLDGVAEGAGQDGAVSAHRRWNCANSRRAGT